MDFNNLFSLENIRKKKAEFEKRSRRKAEDGIEIIGDATVKVNYDIHPDQMKIIKKDVDRFFDKFAEKN